MLREHLYHSCDVGRQPKILKKEFAHYNFNNLRDFWWNNNISINDKTIKKENHNDIKKRLISFLKNIQTLKDKNIVIVSHGTFLSQITNYMLDNCELFICNYDEIINNV